MTKVIPAFLALSFLASSTTAQEWQINIKGTGSMPNIETIQPGISVPPLPAPLPPPIVIPPVFDNSPFTFPVSQPGQEFSGEARYFNICSSESKGGCYASLPEYNNPLSGSHRFACFTIAGMRFASQSIGGFRLYVPSNLEGFKIRTLCAGGNL